MSQSRGVGTRSGWGLGEGGMQYGSPDLCTRRYQRVLHLAVSKPLQKNNKLWTLFDHHLCVNGKRTTNACLVESG